MGISFIIWTKNIINKSGDFFRVRKIQEHLLMNYEQDFSKHAPANVVPRLRMVWNSIPAQLAKENKKFIYGILREGARAKDFEIALQWLVDCGLCHKVTRVTKGALPLKAYCDWASFKLYMADVGLMCAMADVDVKTILDGNRIFTEFKGALTEQYVCQQLISDNRLTPYYWSASNSAGEVDFIVQLSGKVIPVEVKAEENLKARSLKSFLAKYGLEDSFRISMSDYREQEQMINLPLYAVSMMGQVMEQGQG